VKGVAGEDTALIRHVGTVPPYRLAGSPFRDESNDYTHAVSHCL
jgi:hypothetical protein